MENVYSFYNKVFEREFSNIEDIILALKTIGIRSSNSYYKAYWNIKEISNFGDNKKGLFMTCFVCGHWGGWLSSDDGLILIEDEEELKIKYLLHIKTKHSKYYD